MRIRLLASLVVAVLVSVFAFAFTAGAQETTDASATATQEEGSGKPLVFADGERAARAQADDELSGPLAGTKVGTFSTDKDGEVEIITIPGKGCTAKEGASFVLQDEDGTQADFIDDTNVQITETDKGLRVKSEPPAPGADIIPLNERGGQDRNPPSIQGASWS